MVFYKNMSNSLNNQKPSGSLVNPKKGPNRKISSMTITENNLPKFIALGNSSTS